MESTTHLAAKNMPEIFVAGHQLAAERLIVVMFKPSPSYPQPLLHQVMVASRLADKADREWSRTRAVLIRYAADTQSITSAIEATGDFENFVITLGRLLKVHEDLLKALGPRSGISHVVTGHNADAATGEVSRELAERINDFRNRVAHGDEDLRRGRAGRGFPTGSIEIREFDIAIQARSENAFVALSFEEMATALSGIRRHVLDIIQK